MGQNLTAERRKALIASIEKELEHSDDFILQRGEYNLQSAAAMSDDPMASNQHLVDRGGTSHRPPDPNLTVVDDSNEHYTIYRIRIDAAAHKPETLGVCLKACPVANELFPLFPECEICLSSTEVKTDSYAEKAGLVKGDIICWFDPDGLEPYPPRPCNQPGTMLFTLEDFDEYYLRMADEGGLISIFIARKKAVSLSQPPPPPPKHKLLSRRDDLPRKRRCLDTFDDLTNSSRATLPPTATTGDAVPTEPLGHAAPESGTTNNNDTVATSATAAGSIAEHGVNHPKDTDSVVALLKQTAIAAKVETYKLRSNCQTLLDKVRRLQSGCKQVEARINESCAYLLSAQPETTVNVHHGPVYKDLPAVVAAAVPMPRLEGDRHWQAFGTYMQQVKVQLDACEKVDMDLTTCAKAWEGALAKAVASEQKWQKDLKKMRDDTLKCFHEAKQRMLWP